MRLELTPQAEQELKRDIIGLFERFLSTYTKQEPRQTGLISRQQAMAELDIKQPQTLRNWEKMGLRTYGPPLERSHTVYYKISDLLVFLGVEDGNI